MYIKLSPCQQLLCKMYLFISALSPFSTKKTSELPNASHSKPSRQKISVLDQLNKILPLPTDINKIIAAYTLEARYSFLPIQEKQPRDFKDVHLITVDPHTSLPLVYLAELSNSDYQHDPDYQNIQYFPFPETWNQKEIVSFICTASKKQQFWQQEHKKWSFGPYPLPFTTINSHECSENVINLKLKITYSTMRLLYTLEGYNTTPKSNTDPSLAEITQESRFVLIDTTPKQLFQAFKKLGQCLKTIKKTTPNSLGSQLSAVLRHYKKCAKTIETLINTPEDQTVVFMQKEITKPTNNEE